MGKYEDFIRTDLCLDPMCSEYSVSMMRGPLDVDLVCLPAHRKVRIWGQALHLCSGESPVPPQLGRCFKGTMQGPH